MKQVKKNLLFAMYSLFSIIFFRQLQAASLPLTSQEKPFVTNGLLIFLDDQEFKHDQIGAISLKLIEAIMQEAGPIIVSASLLVNLREESPSDAREFFKQINMTENKNLDLISIKADLLVRNKALTDSEAQSIVKKMVNSALSFGIISQHWLMKEISPLLYLLLPKKYLKTKEISIEAASNFAVEGPITAIEQNLGLKINHMKTVSLSDIKNPSPIPLYGNYFMPVLWDEKRKTSDIFVVKNEYSLGNRDAIPTWGIYIEGHGLMGYVISWLAIDDFKEFLHFLETKISTKLLVYNSCYAAGINANLLYQDAEKGIDQAYSFAIITQALTDASIHSHAFQLIFEQNQPKIINQVINYHKFLERITQPGDAIDFNEAIDPLIDRPFNVFNQPQIKFPGLPWFSVLDIQNKVVVIGSILAKSRTAPLDIGTFFKKQGKKAEPLGILLYTENIPFELMVNTKDVPVFVSMIPGNAVHYIKKISSLNHDFKSILYRGFSSSRDFAPHKIFIINKIVTSSTWGGGDNIEGNVVIDVNEGEFSTWYEGIYLTKNQQIATEEEKKQYYEILETYDKNKKARTTKELNALQLKANRLFSQKMSPNETYNNIKQALNFMPDGVELRIPKLIIERCRTYDDISKCNLNDEMQYMVDSNDSIFNCWLSVVVHLIINYEMNKTDKVLWFEAVEICDEANKCEYFRDFVIEIVSGNINIFYKTSNEIPINIEKNRAHECSISISGYPARIKDIFKYTHEYQAAPKEDLEKLESIESRSSHQLLTPEAIVKIKSALEKKIIEAPKK